MCTAVPGGSGGRLVRKTAQQRLIEAGKRRTQSNALRAIQLPSGTTVLNSDTTSTAARAAKKLNIVSK